MNPKLDKKRSHESAVGHVSGKAIYTDDQRLPVGMLSLYPVQSPHARAKITKIDVSSAYEVDGVVTVITADDIPGENDTGTIIHDEVLLPNNEVSYWGQAIVWVVGETEEAARLGAKKVIVEYKILEPILTIKDAIATDNFHNQPLVISRGDTKTTSPQADYHLADYHLAGEVEMNGQDHFYLETHASWVIPDGEGNYQVYASTQHPTETQIIVSRVLGILNNQVVVTCLRMGGGFGGKESQANPFAAIAAITASKTGRPARVKLRRHQDMILTGKRHGFLGKYQVAFTK